MTRSALVWWGLGALAFAIALGAAVDGVFGFEATVIDVWWNDMMGQWRTPALVAIAYFFDAIGGGWIATYAVPLTIAAGLLIARRWRSAIFALLAFLVSVVLVQTLKDVFGRDRPEEMLVASDYGSFPSGHTANAATIATVAVLLFPRLWTMLLAALWVLAMALSRTVLSVHWMSDTIGGALVGIAASLLLAAVMLGWVRQPPSRPTEPLATLE